MDRKKIILISLLHFFVDIYAGFFVIYKDLADLDKVHAAFIATATALVANGLQPFMGYVADRIRGKRPIFLGMLVGAVLMSSIGFTRSALVLFFLVFIGKLGTAFFHPAASNIAGAAGAARKDRSFSIFITVGTLGFAFSQIFFAAFEHYVGMEYSLVLALPAVLVALYYLFFSNVTIHGDEKRVDFAEVKRVLREKFKPVLLLFLVMVFRTIFGFSMIFFIPTMCKSWGFSKMLYSGAGTVYILSGAAGMLAAGYLAHIISPRRILFYSMVLFLPFFFAFLYFGIQDGLYDRIGLSFFFLALTGFMLNAGHPANIVMGQRLLPEVTSTVSGILMGFAWAVANIGPMLTVLLHGAIRPFGIESGLIILSASPLVAAGLVLFLPKKVETG